MKDEWIITLKKENGTIVATFYDQGMAFAYLESFRDNLNEGETVTLKRQRSRRPR